MVFDHGPAAPPRERMGTTVTARLNCTLSSCMRQAHASESDITYLGEMT